ncbi:hypothetical protein DFH06DRAFT_1318732 [Mycena polygramma]|nr:hypothetical protein DFH06DRAFT_1318732 [Mycena polygramma]
MRRIESVYHRISSVRTVRLVVVALIPFRLRPGSSSILHPSLHPRPPAPLDTRTLTQCTVDTANVVYSQLDRHQSRRNVEEGGGGWRVASGGWRVAAGIDAHTHARPVLIPRLNLPKPAAGRDDNSFSLPNVHKCGCAAARIIIHTPPWRTADMRRASPRAPSPRDGAPTPPPSILPTHTPDCKHHGASQGMAMYFFERPAGPPGNFPAPECPLFAPRAPTGLARQLAPYTGTWLVGLALVPRVPADRPPPFPGPPPPAVRVPRPARLLAISPLIARPFARHFCRHRLLIVIPPCSRSLPRSFPPSPPPQLPRSFSPYARKTDALVVAVRAPCKPPPALPAMLTQHFALTTPVART